MEHGLRLPNSDIVVAVETNFGATGGRAAQQSSQDLAKETDEIARLMGPGTPTGRASEYLTCLSRTNNVCWSAKEQYVLVVSGLLEGSPSILIQFYTPAVKNKGVDTATMAIVDVERRGQGWAGVRFRTEPTTLSRKQ